MFIFEDPTILDELDQLHKSDTARKLVFYYQPDLQTTDGGEREERKEGIVLIKNLDDSMPLLATEDGQERLRRK